MADTVRDRYQRAMSVPQDDVGKVGRLLKTLLSSAPQQSAQGASPLLGGKMPAYEQPYTGLRNEAAPQSLPPFEQPGASLHMQNYMPQAMTEPHGVASMPAPTPQPQMTAPPAFQPAAMPASIEPVPQIGDPKVLALIEAMAKPKPAPWAVNEGNFMDQYGG